MLNNVPGSNLSYDPSSVASALGFASEMHLESLVERREGYQGIHLGTRDLAIGTLLDVLSRSPGLRPPRGGHIGNWEDIALGRAGPMDFNKAICSRGLGFPLIYCFTQTEAENAAGDWVYLPGSLVERGQRTLLPLYTWDGASFARRTRERSYFCPFVQTEVDGSLQPLIELHWSRMGALRSFEFELEQGMLFHHRTELVGMLAELMERASRARNPRKAFQDVISHAVCTDGTISRCSIRKDGNDYWLDDVRYASISALVEHAIFPFEAVARPRDFFAKIRDLPRLLPVMSNVVGRLFSAHFPRRQGHAINLSLQWGARDMAGFPPRRRGYFISKARNFQVLADALVATCGDFTPICSVLLPAAIFLLCPSDVHPPDSDLLAELFATVLHMTASGDSGAAMASPRELELVEDVTRSWKARSGGALSPYFLSRFRPRSGLIENLDAPVESEPVEPPGFRTLSLRHACMIVGALSTVESSPADARED